MNTHTQDDINNIPEDYRGNPGSDEAIKHGCTCPVMDNRHGEGVPSSVGALFWMNKDCPIHGEEA